MFVALEIYCFIESHKENWKRIFTILEAEAFVLNLIKRIERFIPGSKPITSSRQNLIKRIER